MRYGATDISPSLQSSVASRQYVESLSEAANGELRKYVAVWPQAIRKQVLSDSGKGYIRT